MLMQLLDFLNPYKTPEQVIEEVVLPCIWYEPCPEQDKPEQWPLQTMAFAAIAAGTVGLAFAYALNKQQKGKTTSEQQAQQVEEVQEVKEQQDDAFKPNENHSLLEKWAQNDDMTDAAIVEPKYALKDLIDFDEEPSLRPGYKAQ